MSDLIDRTELKNAIDEWYTKIKNPSIDTEDMYISIMMTIDEMEKSNKWITCSKKPPTKTSYYITTIVHAYSDHDGFKDVRIVFFDSNYNFWVVDNSYYKVIAWMPKPEPYTEVSE